jgi:hypothetical protein
VPHPPYDAAAARFYNGNVPTGVRNVWIVDPHVLEVEKLCWTGPGRPKHTPVLREVTGTFTYTSLIISPQSALTKVTSCR